MISDKGRILSLTACKARFSFAHATLIQEIVAVQRCQVADDLLDGEITPTHFRYFPLKTKQSFRRIDAVSVTFPNLFEKNSLGILERVVRLQRDSQVIPGHEVT